jgi:multicomponent Na+:H+ antiporter subunit C
VSGYLPYFLLIALMLVGIYCVASKKNLVKIVAGLAIAQCAVNLFLVAMGYNANPVSVKGPAGADVVRSGLAPVESVGMDPKEVLAFSDPVPQAMALTSLVVGLCVVALAAAICVRLYERYRTYDVSEIKRLRG